jgi:hypothetical protein
MWSAFADTWQSALQHRSIPALQTAMKQMTGAAGWAGGFNPFTDEMLEICELPKLADIPDSTGTTSERSTCSASARAASCLCATRRSTPTECAT